MSLGEHSRSEAVFRDVLKKNPSSGCAHLGLANLFSQDGAQEKVSLWDRVLWDYFPDSGSKNPSIELQS